MRNLYYFLTIGGSQIKSSLSGSTSTDGINTFLKNCGVAVGAIIIALAAINDSGTCRRERSSPSKSLFVTKCRLSVCINKYNPDKYIRFEWYRFKYELYNSC